MTAPASGPLLIASSNPGKILEFRSLIPARIDLISLIDVAVDMPEESGTTFRENADLKAVVAAKATGLLTLGDDSGLEVDVLGGCPGVRTARFAGEPPDAVRNRIALLAALKGTAPGNRTARFVCAVTLANAFGILTVSEGELRGTISEEERGSAGFGYDPIFLLPDGRTLAELLDEEKNAVSHRGAAIAAILPALHDAIQARAAQNQMLR